MNNLNTLKAKAREVVMSCVIETCMPSEKLLYKDMESKYTLFLRERLIDTIAVMMQGHENWTDELLAKLRCRDCHTYHNPVDPCLESSAILPTGYAASHPVKREPTNTVLETAPIVKVPCDPETFAPPVAAETAQSTPVKCNCNDPGRIFACSMHGTPAVVVCKPNKL